MPYSKVERDRFATKSVGKDIYIYIYIYNKIE